MNYTNYLLMRPILKTLFTFVFCLATWTAIAQERFYQDIVGFAVQPGASFVVEDDKFLTPAWSTIEAPQQTVRGLVTLEVNQNSVVVTTLPDDIIVDLQITLEYDGAPTQIVSKSLELIYDPTLTNSSDDQSFAIYDNVHRMTIDVLAVHINTISMNPAPSPPYSIRLSGEIYVDRIYNFDTSTPPTIVGKNHINGHLNVTWLDVPGAAEYDLEWVFYDDKSEVGAATNGSSFAPSADNIPALFRCNASRISTDQLSFDIPLIYPEGHLFYRVRAVRYTYDSLRQTTYWSTQPYLGSYHDFPDRYVVPWHEENLNWQSQVSFAEEGKNVPSVRYFDGSLRERQAVTYSNAIDMSITEQTIYDHQGRPAVAVMAAPTFIDSLAFLPNFASDPTGTTPYDKSNFDIDTKAIPDPMSDLSGAAKYYSANNPESTNGFHQYIPKADGHPFTVTEYTPDPTGRIQRQSGVGETFKLGSDHETRYFYGKPAQGELDRLFGNDVGNANHYAKNMVSDANGQVSISYVDGHGRTIATALTGDSPSNVENLTSLDISEPNFNNTVNESTANAVSNFERDLLNNVDSTYALISTYTLTIPKEQDYTFHYSADSILVKKGCLPAHICYDCAYDVHIEVKSSSSSADFNGGMPYNYTQSNVTLLDTTANPSVNTGFYIDFSLLNMPQGEYQITKRLSLSQDALAYYVEDFMSRETCLPSLADLTQQFIDSTNFSGCNMDATDCMDDIGTLDDFIMELRADALAGGGTFTAADSMQAMVVYEQLVQECESLDASFSECEHLRTLLLNDISPGGQYAGYSFEDTLILENDIYSIFSDITNGIVSNGNHAPTAGIDYTYQACFEQSVLAGIVPNEDVIINGQTKKVYELSPEELIVNWRDEWAEGLLHCHPEYECFLAWCNDSNNVAFDSLLYSLESYDEALMQFPDLDQNVAAILDNDPFFSMGTVEYDTMLMQLTNVNQNETCYEYSILNLIASITYCQGNFNCPTQLGAGCTADNDLAWMLYRQYYLSLKGRFKNLGTVRTSDMISPSIIDRAPNTTELSANPNFVAASTPYHAIPGGPSPMPIYMTSSNSADIPVRMCDITATTLDACVDSVSICIDWDFKLGFGGGGSSRTLPPGYFAAISMFDAGALVSDEFLKKEVTVADSFNISGCIKVLAADVSDLSFAFQFKVFDGTAIPDIWWLSTGIDMTMDVAALDDTPACMQCVVPDDKETRLVPYTIDDLNPTETELQDQADEIETQIYEECYSYCESNADAWMAILGQECTMTTTEYDAIRAGLIEVCKEGCDPEHPFGASTTGGITTPGGYTSFDEVVQTVMSTSACDACSGHLITFPAPHGGFVYQGALASTFISRANDDNCICDNLTDFEAQYLADNEGFMTFTDFLNQFSNIQLSEEEVNSLLSYCMDQTCNTLEENVRIPPYLECDVCKTCAEVNTALSSFTCTSTGAAYEDLRAQHLNQAFGFSLSALDYNIFLDQCDPAISGTNGFEYLCPINFSSPLLQDTSACYQALIYDAQVNAQLEYDRRLDSIKNDFISIYLEECLSTIDETFTANGELNEYHFTLYYYDQAGNLIKTIPPNGVNPLDAAGIAAVQAHRDDPVTTASPTYPSHTYETVYQYNSLNQIVYQDSPDATHTEFWYDRVGRAVISQDGRQRAMSRYSYTRYDPLGRIEEVGEVANTTAMTATTARDPIDLENWINSGSDFYDVTHTYYDTPAPFALMVGTDLIEQENLRPRVSYVTRRNGLYTAGTYDMATFYSYDVTGNVKTLVQESAFLGTENQFKRIDYEYDYISGNVNKVFYQRGKQDQFTYRYEYDENNRLIAVYTSFVETDNDDSPLWERDASYEYYLHGPLARMEIGEQRVQGCDYAYTLQGWIKGVNSTILNPNRDMGRDGTTNMDAARDALSYTLGYYDGDYGQIGGTPMEMTYTATTLETASPSLYNGNIRHMALEMASTNTPPMAYTYKYDQLHRLVEMQPYDKVNTGAYTWQTIPINPNQNYKVEVLYDNNGNIRTLKRRADAFKVMDDMYYYYHAGTNKLERIVDFRPDSEFPNDLDSQPANNYIYDDAGNIRRDIDSGANLIHWNAYGKVERILGAKSVFYKYDAHQNRGVNVSYNSGADYSETHHVRDAQGNVLAVYHRDTPGASPKWREQYIYGSSRVGAVYPDVEMDGTAAVYNTPHFNSTKKLSEGDRTYELTNHLGNVLATINDRRQEQDPDNNSIVDYYEAVVVNAQDYYPFGLRMGGRSYSAAGTNYRYGFNGKEIDQNGEWGTLNHYDYGFRIYNPSAGRFLSVDPMADQFAFVSPFNYAENRPINGIDLHGLQYVDVNTGESGPIDALNSTSTVSEEYDVNENGEQDYYLPVVTVTSASSTETPNSDTRTEQEGRTMPAHIRVAHWEASSNTLSSIISTLFDTPTIIEVPNFGILGDITGANQVMTDMNYSLDVYEAEGLNSYLYTQVDIAHKEIAQGAMGRAIRNKLGSSLGSSNTAVGRTRTTNAKTTSSPIPTVRVSGQDRVIHTGPRGGKYYINKNGNRTYLNRDGTKRKR